VVNDAMPGRTVPPAAPAGTGARGGARLTPFPDLVESVACALP
jgi:hypothetical protein